MAANVGDKAQAELSREELMALARDLVPVLQERALLAEELRQCPPETVQDFAQGN